MLRKKKILITGATGDIGSEISFLFAKNNAELLLAGKDKKKLINLRSKILKSYKTKINIYSFDIGKHEETKSTFKDIFSKNKNIDVLVNNAGILKEGLIGMISEKDIKNTIGTNLIGPINLIQLVNKIMNKKNSSIINISSIMGVRGNSGQSLYSSSKSGLIGFTLSAAKELGSKGIRVNAIAPGYIKTKMVKHITKDKLSNILSSIKMKRPGKPIDVANVALFLASDLSTYVTGQVIGVDGGMIV
jgi:3-oxoacyl-[acyl-carrier protein] reductase